MNNFIEYFEKCKEDFVYYIFIVEIFRTVEIFFARVLNKRFIIYFNIYYTHTGGSAVFFCQCKTPNDLFSICISILFTTYVFNDLQIYIKNYKL